MNFYELIRCAILNLRAHKLRVFLTMIGIIIGIASVVAILSIGAGLQAQVSDSTVSESVNTLRVTYEPDEQSMMQWEPPFRYQDFRALENIDGVEKVEQSNDTTKKEHSGLGLYIIKQIVELNGGQLELREAKEYSGVEFAIYIPWKC